MRIYRRPLETLGKVIDEGHFLFAVIAAVMCAVLLQAPRNIEFWRGIAAAKAYVATHQAEVAQARLEMAKEAAKTAPTTAPGIPDDSDDEDLPARSPGLSRMMPARFAKPDLKGAVETFTGHSLFRYFSGLVAIALCFVPLAIMIITLWDSLGGVMTILFRDYLTLLVCVLLAWTAAYLPLALGRAALVLVNAPASSHPGYWWVSHGYFVLLSVCAVRTVFGTSFRRAAAAAAGGWAGSIGGLCLYSVAGSSLSWLASPFVLYYVYAAVRPDFRSFGVSFHSRQRLKEYLENATVNPRDADAHYQLGLIYQQRRQFGQATDRFKKAIEIDSASADAHYQLGRIARQTGQWDAAIGHLRAAAAADDKCSSSEVWRETGVVHLLNGQWKESREALEKYLERRPYDPEGQCWYGRTLLKLGLHEPARLAFTEAIEAVRTMPKGRKKQVSTWGSQAGKELRTLERSGK